MRKITHQDSYDYSWRIPPITTLWHSFTINTNSVNFPLQPHNWSAKPLHIYIDSTHGTHFWIYMIKNDMEETTYTDKFKEYSLWIGWRKCRTNLNGSTWRFALFRLIPHSKPHLEELRTTPCVALGNFSPINSSQLHMIVRWYRHHWAPTKSFYK